MAIGRLPLVSAGFWAVGGSAALALHGLPIEPRDVDILADDVAIEELIAAMADFVISDDTPWDRGDVRATRRVLAVINDVQLEILVGVESVALNGTRIGPPDLVDVDHVDSNGRQVPVLPLSSMATLLEATGNSKRAAMVREALALPDGSHGPRADR